MGKKKNICLKCYQQFISKQQLGNHQKLCKQDPFGGNTKTKNIKKTDIGKKKIDQNQGQDDVFFDQQSPSGWKPSKMCDQTLQVESLTTEKKKKIRRMKIVDDGNQAQQIVGDGFKMVQKIWYCTVTGCHQLIGPNKGKLFAYASQPQLKRHQRENHGMNFECINNGDQVCFLCIDSRKTYYHTQLRQHLELIHKINFDGKDVGDIKKQYAVKKCIFCQKNFQACFLTQHYQEQHKIQDKTWEEIHQMWDKFVSKRSQYDIVNLNMKETFLSRLKREFVRTYNEIQKKMPQMSKFLSSQAYYLERQGRFLVAALKNAFDLEIQWPVTIFANSLWSMLSQLESIEQFRFQHVHQVKKYIQESNLVEKRRRASSKKVRQGLQRLGFVAQFQETYFPTPQLYQFYEQLINAHDCFTVYDQKFKKLMLQQRKSIQIKMGQFQVNYKEEKHYRIKRVGNKKQKQFITKQKALELRVPNIFKKTQDQYFRQSLIDNYWNKTRRQALLFRRIFFKQIIFLPKWERKYERKKKKENQEKYVIPPQYYWRTLTRQEAQQQLRKDMPRQAEYVQKTYKNKANPKISSDSEEDQLTFRQRRWFEQNMSLCHPHYFHKDSKYRRRIMSYPFPQYYHRNLVQKIIAKRHPRLSQTFEQQNQRKQRYQAQFRALLIGQPLNQKKESKYDKQSQCIKFLSQIGQFVEDSEQEVFGSQEQMSEESYQSKEKCDVSEEDIQIE